MQRIIIGTAGHVDHGKSALARALTGVDPDRLPEEKQRGMTIDLGFVFLPISAEEEVAIIDVPGHEGLLRTMIAGANSIRVVLLVVAADEGIMPQTIEHLDVLKLLGVEKGIIVITKIDRTESDYVSLVEEEIRELTQGSFLENAPVCRVSSVTGQGLGELKETIRSLCQEIEPLADVGIFRCPIDRIFTIKGFGTVVAGTVISGRLKVSESVEVLPIMKKSRLRNLQVHNQPAPEVFAGQRVAFNLMDLSVQEIARGYELSMPEYLVPTQVVNSSVFVLANAQRPLASGARVRLHKGTGETMARAIILDKEKIEPGDRGYVQFRLEKPIVGERKERFILRSYSPMKVIGGGQLLEVHARKGGRLKGDRLNYLGKMEKAGEQEFIEIIISQAKGPIASEKELARLTGTTLVKITDELHNLQNRKQVVRLKDNSIVHRKTIAELKASFVTAISDYIKANPTKVFMSVGDVMRASKVSNSSLCTFVIEGLESEGKIERKSDGVRVIGLEARISPAMQRLLEQIERFAVNKGYQPIRLDDLVDHFSSKGQERLKNLLDYLSKTGRLVEIREGAYLHGQIIEKAKSQLLDWLKTRGSIRAAEFREVCGVSRDLARDILDYFLSQGVTVRTEGIHRLASGSQGK